MKNHNPILVMYLNKDFMGFIDQNNEVHEITMCQEDICKWLYENKVHPISFFSQELSLVVCWTIDNFLPEHLIQHIVRKYYLKENVSA